MKNLFSLIFVCLLSIAGKAQEPDWLGQMEDSLPRPFDKTESIFSSTRVINAHSVEMLNAGNLDFRIMHRFGFLNEGLKTFFGLDAASMRMSFDYGITNNFTIGVGRSTYHKELDGFLKFRLLQQSNGDKPIPFSLVFIAGAMVYTEASFAVPKPDFADRSAHYVQMLVGRKFSPAFSLQFSPLLLRTQRPIYEAIPRTIFAAGMGSRIKLSKRLALTLDYHVQIPKSDSAFSNPLSVGFDIETGGHVFQLQFSNATGMNERAFISETTGDFWQGDIRFGFNLSRIFQVKRKKLPIDTAFGGSE